MYLLSFGSENVGLIGLTRVGSRRVIQIAALFMLFFSVFGESFRHKEFPSVKDMQYYSELENILELVTSEITILD